MIVSTQIMTNKGDNTHPCPNPHFTSNQSVSPSRVLTVHGYLCTDTGRPSKDHLEVEIALPNALFRSFTEATRL